MAAASMMAELEEFVTCEICYNSFEGRDPRQLACCHAFCLSCIRDVYETELKKQPGTDKVTCPKCQRGHTIPDREVDNLPSYFQASQVHDIMRRHKDGAKEVTEQSGGLFRMCMLCKKTESSACCFSCVRVMCGACYSSHKQNKRYVEHTATKMTKREITLSVCPHHGDLFEAYCTNCCRSVCKICLLSDHNEHDIIDFSLDSPNTDEIEAEFKETKAQADRNIAEVDEIETSVEVCVQDLDAIIVQRQVDLQKQINDQTESLRAEIQVFKADKLNELEEIRNENQSVYKTVQELEDKLLEYRRPVAGLAQVGLKNIQLLMENLHKGMPSVEYGVQVNTDCSFVPVTEDVTVGMVQYPDLTKTDSGMGDAKVKDNTGATSKAQATLDSETVTPNIAGAMHAMEGTAMVEAPSCLSLPKPAQLLWKVKTIDVVDSVDFLPNGNVIAAVNDKAHVYKAGVKIALPFKFPESVKSVSVYRPENKIFIGTYQLYVEIWTHDLHKSIKKWVCTRHTIDDYRTFTYLTLSPQGHLMAVDSDQNICFFSGNKKHTLYDADGEDRLKCSFCAVSNNGHFILSDCEIVSILSVKAYPDSVDIIGGRDLDSVDMPNPGALCTDSKDNILVADGEKKAVLLFSPKGTLIREVVKLDDVPTDIALYEDKYLAVGTWDVWHNDRGTLSVYQVDLTV